MVSIAGRSSMFFIILILGVPVVALVSFIICLIKYLTCPVEHVQEKRKWRTVMIVTGVVCLVFITVLVSLIILLAVGIGGM